MIRVPLWLSEPEETRRRENVPVVHGTLQRMRYLGLVGQDVEAYFNRRNGAWSIRAAGRGRVLGHTHAAILADVRFVISDKGRARVVRTGKRDVHAWVRGRLVDVPVPNAGWQVTYNPFDGRPFHLRAGPAVDAAHLVRLSRGECNAYFPTWQGQDALDPATHLE